MYKRSCLLKLNASLMIQKGQVMAYSSGVHLLLLLIATVTVPGAKMSAEGKTFTIVNKCKETVWPAIITHTGNNKGEGFTLKPGQSATYNASATWSGRIWARTHCNFDQNGTGTCLTGNCGTTLNCTQSGSPPTTIAEFTLGEVDFYDVSLVDGFNVPIEISPLNGKGNCSNGGCDGDLRQSCPAELALNSSGSVIACRSACDVFNTDEYCCRGAYVDPVACVPTNYSKGFKQVCPSASSRAYDDLITCSASEYVVAFCATRNQTVCSYSDHNLSCNTSKGSKIPSQRWWILALLLPLTLHNVF